MRLAITNRSISKHSLAILTLAFALTALASPGHAQSAARAAAIHECSVLASKYIEHTWADFEIQVYRSCMAQRGQPE